MKWRSPFQGHFMIFKFWLSICCYKDTDIYGLIKCKKCIYLIMRFSVFLRLSIQNWIFVHSPAIIRCLLKVSLVLLVAADRVTSISPTFEINSTIPLRPNKSPFPRPPNPPIYGPSPLPLPKVTFHSPTYIYNWLLRWGK